MANAKNKPLEHTANIKKNAQHFIKHLCSDVSKIDDQSAKPLFETAAEVFIDLEKAFTDYTKK